jgi:hypothetical protein
MNNYILVGETLEYRGLLATGDFKITYKDIDAYIGEITSALDIYIRKGNYNGYIGYLNKNDEIVLDVEEFKGVVGYIDDLKIYLSENGLKILFD